MIYSTNAQNSVKVAQPLPTQSVIGFPVAALSFYEQADIIIRWARTRASKVVCVSNVHMLMEGHWNPDFAQLLRQSDLLTPDGMPLVWMTALMKGHAQDRVAGMDLMMALCQKAQAKNISIFFLGSTDDVLARIKDRLAVEFPYLRIAGMVSPPFRPMTLEEDNEIAVQINRSGAGLVFVAFGCPKQERWMNRQRGKVQAVMVGLGGAFAVYSGNKHWAPRWMRKNGMEWSYRLLQDPRRLWKRYASTIPPFIYLAMKQVISLRIGSSSDRL